MEENDRMDEIGEQMKALAVEGVALSVRGTAAAVAEASGLEIDPVSFLAGVVSAKLADQGCPQELMGEILGGFIAELAPALTGMPDPETAFDDLPIYDPEKEEE